MLKKFKRIPKFKTEAEERKFWQTHSSVDYLDWSYVLTVRFPNLQLTNKPVTVRLPLALIDRLKIKANQRDIPYQSLMKDILFRGLAAI